MRHDARLSESEGSPSSGTLAIPRRDDVSHSLLHDGRQGNKAAKVGHEPVNWGSD